MVVRLPRLTGITCGRCGGRPQLLAATRAGDLCAPCWRALGCPWPAPAPPPLERWEPAVEAAAPALEAALLELPGL